MPVVIRLNELCTNVSAEFGAWIQRPQTVVMANNAINLKVIEESAVNGLIRNASKKGKVVSIDLKKMGYDKLLGTGVPSQAYKITISAGSAKAVEKVEAAGGEVING